MTQFFRVVSLFLPFCRSRAHKGCFHQYQTNCNQTHTAKNIRVDFVLNIGHMLVSERTLHLGFVMKHACHVMQVLDLQTTSWETLSQASGKKVVLP